MSNRERNYTMIDELEDISDMPQQQQDIIPNDISEKIKGKIRHNYAAPQAAGMGSFNYQNIPKQQHPLYPQQPPPPPQMYENYDKSYTVNYGRQPHAHHHDEYDHYPMIRENFETSPPPSDINCRQVAEHIQDCPICSKLYQHDRMHTIYIIIIVFLAIACLLLLKKNLNI